MDNGEPSEPLSIDRAMVSDGAATENGGMGAIGPHPCRPETLRAEIPTVPPLSWSFCRYSLASPPPCLLLDGRTHGRTHGQTDGRTHGRAAARPRGRPPACPRARPRGRPRGRRERGDAYYDSIPPKRAMCHVPEFVTLYVTTCGIVGVTL